jgi:N-acetylmuramoyl-L-alanine amidase
MVAVPSPNHGPRKAGARPDLILIHYTGMISTDAALARLRDPAAEVSAHYLLAEDGRIFQMVGENRRAWHAGLGQWGHVTDINSRSIGIELANPGPLDGYPPFPERQMVALERLIDAIRGRWAIPPERVLGHSDTAPGRKFDPGPKFDWRRLARCGRAVWPGSSAAARCDWAAFARAAGRAGYGRPEGGWDAVLHAVRLRLRPWALGADLQVDDMAALLSLPAVLAEERPPDGEQVGARPREPGSDGTL